MKTAFRRSHVLPLALGALVLGVGAQCATSMGHEKEAAQRRRDFKAFQVNRELLAHARRGAVVMHCLPAHRGEEVSVEAMDSDRSIVFQQAGNRMHAQKALLKWLMM